MPSDIIDNAVCVCASVGEGLDVATITGIIASLASIILAIISIVYTCSTSRKTENLLNDIREQNRKLVEKINQDLIRGNYGKDNLESINEKIEKLSYEEAKEDQQEGD